MHIQKISEKGRIRAIAALSVLALLHFGFDLYSKTQDLPEDPYERGLALLKQFKYSEAKASFDKAVKSNPKNKRALYYRGEARIELGQLEAAMADFNESLKIDPEFALGYLGKSQIHTKKKDFPAAMEQLSKAQDLDPKNAEVFYQKGVILGYQKKVEEAIGSFKNCLEEKPDHVYAHYQIGLAYYQIKRPDLMVVHLEKFLSLAPEAPEAEQVRKLLSSLRK